MKTNCYYCYYFDLTGYSMKTNCYYCYYFDLTDYSAKTTNCYCYYYLIGSTGCSAKRTNYCYLTD